MPVPDVTLVSFTAARLPDIEPWFDHPEVQRWLGDRSWPRRELELVRERPGTTHRGMRTLRSYGWVALDDWGKPVAHIGGDVTDRWVLYRGDTGDLLNDDDIYPHRSMDFAYVVDPSRWRQGYAAATIRAAIAEPTVADVRAFWCGIHAENIASRRLVLSVGFELWNEEPDFEGIHYYRYLKEATDL